MGVHALNEGLVWMILIFRLIIAGGVGTSSGALKDD
jgi:hypothetical protein